MSYLKVLLAGIAVNNNNSVFGPGGVRGEGLSHSMPMHDHRSYQPISSYWFATFYDNVPSCLPVDEMIRNIDRVSTIPLLLFFVSARIRSV